LVGLKFTRIVYQGWRQCYWSTVQLWFRGFD
jgi:hypothetical protein